METSESHWLVGWVEWIAIHSIDTTALQAADSAMERLADFGLRGSRSGLAPEREETNAT
jgi:hypothetical protein